MKILFIFVALYLLFNCAWSENENKNADCPKIKSKQQWEGIVVNEVANQTLPAQNIIIHHTVSQECHSFEECVQALKNIQSHHMRDRKFEDIAYNFLIAADGLVYEGRGWNKIGNHTRGFNWKSIGIAFIGNFTSKPPTADAFNACKQLLRCGVDLGMIAPDYNLLAARQVSNTISPGLPIFGEIQEWDHWKEATSIY